jgi:hypothetical protein
MQGMNHSCFGPEWALSLPWMMGRRAIVLVLIHLYGGLSIPTL